MEFNSSKREICIIEIIFPNLRVLYFLSQVEYTNAPFFFLFEITFYRLRHITINLSAIIWRIRISQRAAVECQNGARKGVSFVKKRTQLIL